MRLTFFERNRMYIGKIDRTMILEGLRFLSNKTKE